MKSIILDLENYLSWRSPNIDLEIRVVGGDAVVLTVSKNGHDAEAKHLDVKGSGLVIKSGEWYTVETVGTRSEICFDIDSFEERIADADWIPVPRGRGIHILD